MLTDKDISGFVRGEMRKARQEMEPTHMASIDAIIKQQGFTESDPQYRELYNHALQRWRTH